VIYLSYLDSKEAKKGKRHGIIEIIVGYILVIASFISIIFSILFSQRYSGKIEINHLIIGIDILLTGLFIIGVFKIYSYYNYLEYLKKMRIKKY
jgi:uncharacterized membrane protein